MSADGVYDDDFFAALADRGFYVFTSGPIAAAKPQAFAARSSAPVLSTGEPSAEASDNALVEAA